MRYVIHAALSGVLALPEQHAEAIIDALSPASLDHLTGQLRHSAETFLWLRDGKAMGNG